MHTNGTIGGLLNATFGNAPELLIATAAMRSGYYRITQLVMLGSMLTNMLLVFGIACAIGGARWQVQELRTTSGNANVVMLYVAVAGCLLPAALRLSGQYNNIEGVAGKVYNEEAISPQEVTFCRVNAVVLFVLYLCFLVFQLGTHSDEFADDAANRRSRRYARRNHACRWFGNWLTRRSRTMTGHTPLPTSSEPVERLPFLNTDDVLRSTASMHAVTASSTNVNMDQSSGHHPVSAATTTSMADEEEVRSTNTRSVESNSGAVRRRGGNATSDNASPPSPRPIVSSHVPRSLNNNSYEENSAAASHKAKSKSSDWEDLESENDDEESMSRTSRARSLHSHGHHHQEDVPQLSMRMGIMWLLILTLCISSMSDILVDTIDDFAFSMHLSEVFTSMVVIPFFSNVAEQVSAFIFAYRNEMDLCVAVTIGSAVQIATFVLPGTVIIGMTLQRSMTLYFGAYETCCLFFSVVVVGAVLQSGTSNWLTGCMLVGIYVILASGIWFHQQENLTVDEENNLAWKGAHDGENGG